jgi:phosphoglycolate phosphatase-like HAD superfamily hydrolase
MPILSISGKKFDIDLIVFDKDGTLIDIDRFWGPRTERWVTKLAGTLPDIAGIEESIFDIIGYSPQLNQIRPESPLAVASMDSISTLAAGVLCQHGTPWHAAKRTANQFAQDTMMGPFNPEEISPIGDVSGTLASLSKSHFLLAVATSDEREMTGATLAYLGVEHLIDILVCGDDDIPNKPSPEGIWHISEALGVPPSRMLMVGDTVSDMVFGKNAGVAGLVGIYDGKEKDSPLAAHADVLVESIAMITVDNTP